MICRAQRERIRPEFVRLTRLYRTRHELNRLEVIRIVVALADTTTEVLLKNLS